MIKASSLTREQFISWIGESYEPFPSSTQLHEFKETVRVGSIWLIWNSEEVVATGPSSRPIISLRDEEVQDFFAFVNTYIGSYQPFSAFFRVVKLSQLPELLFGRKQTSVHHTARYIGAIIAEARLQLGEPKRELSDIPIQSCLATLSASAVGGLSREVSDRTFEEILRDWIACRNRLSTDPLTVPANRVADFWMALRDALRQMSSTSGARDGLTVLISDALSSRDQSESVGWQILTERLPRSRRALQRMRDSREERVRAMDEISEEITSARMPVEIAEVLLGYASSRVAEGSLRYFPILQSIEDAFPLCSMWFGFFCSLREDTDAMVVGDCLGRRIERNISKEFSIFDPPSSDLSIDEFVVTASASKPTRWRTEHQTAISIEIYPGVNSVFRLVTGASRKGSAPLNSISARDLDEIRYLSTRLFKAVEALDPSDQGRLFPELPKSRLKNPKRNDR